MTRGPRFATALKAVVAASAFFAIAAHADAIQSWRAPSGSLYSGDHPPAGSTLLTTYAESPRDSAVDTPAGSTALSREAAEGRDIIRRREEERIAERQREQQRDDEAERE